MLMSMPPIFDLDWYENYSCDLDTALTLCPPKPTMQHSDPHKTSTKFFTHCDNLLWHFDPVTIFYRDILNLK